MKLYIKNMVCGRCKMVVRTTLEQLGLHPVSVELGEVELSEDTIDPHKQPLNEALHQLGFELIDDKKSRIIERIKVLLIELVAQPQRLANQNLSDYLAQELGQDYSALSNLFSSLEGITIEKYYIELKIEKVKELLTYDELSLKEIAYQLQYSSVAHLSNQFKKVTGLSPSHFKQIKENKRRQIEEI